MSTKKAPFVACTTATLFDPINIYIYDPGIRFAQTARKFGFVDLTDPVGLLYHLGRRQGNSPGDKPLQEVDHMQEDNSMTRDELEELMSALLEAERLRILAVLRQADSLDAAIAAIEQRLNG